jgi:hypothetical protein
VKSEATPSVGEEVAPEGAVAQRAGRWPSSLAVGLEDQALYCLLLRSGNSHRRPRRGEPQTPESIAGGPGRERRRGSPCCLPSLFKGELEKSREGGRQPPRGAPPGHADAGEQDAPPPVVSWHGRDRLRRDARL